MIGIFPKAYDDELVYSLLARVGVYNGFLNYRLLARELFVDWTKTPQIEYINCYKDEISLRILESFLCDSLSELIDCGTMFSYNTRFYNSDDRHKAKMAIIEGGKIADEIRITTGTERFLRYCPMCVKNDRERFGETYWHRAHQMVGIGCCPIHGCVLVSSVVNMSGKASPNFLPAEMYAESDDIQYATEKEVNIARYNDILLKSPILDNTYLWVIKNYLYEMKLISKRGAANHNQQIADYLNKCCDRNWEAWQIQKLLDGKRRMPYEISTVAVTLGISAEELLKPINPSFVVNDFDNKVRQLLDEKKGVKQTARILGVSDGTVRMIRDEKRKTGRRGVGGCKKKDWSKIDVALLPKVKAYVNDIKLQEASGKRPVKITAYAVARHIGVSPKSFDRLKNCADFLAQFEECQEEYWARELVWAVKYIKASGDKMQYTTFRRLLNVRREYLVSALPYIKDKYAGKIIEYISKQ